MSRSEGRALRPAPTPSSTTSQEAGAAHWLGPARGGAQRVGGDSGAAVRGCGFPSKLALAGVSPRGAGFSEPGGRPAGWGWARRWRGPDRKLRRLAGPKPGSGPSG